MLHLQNDTLARIHAFMSVSPTRGLDMAPLCDTARIKAEEYDLYPEVRHAFWGMGSSLLQGPLQQGPQFCEPSMKRQARYIVTEPRKVTAGNTSYVTACLNQLLQRVFSACAEGPYMQACRHGQENYVHSLACSLTPSLATSLTHQVGATTPNSGICLATSFRTCVLSTSSLGLWRPYPRTN